MSKGVGVLASLAAKKMANKLAAKITAKYRYEGGAKGVGGFLPLVGPIIGAGVNAYLVNGIGTSAELYYSHKGELPEGNGPPLVLA